MIEDTRTGAHIVCLGSDPRRAHGKAPTLTLADEPAQWPETTGEAMVAALTTAAGKQPRSLFVALGTRPAASEHWFAKWLAGQADYAQCHAAQPLDPLFRQSTWFKANPSARYLPDLLAAIRHEARQARQDPATLASFKALRLNLGTSDVEASLLLSAELWEELSSQSAEADGAPIWGADLGGSAASSAVVAFWPSTGLLRAVAAFPERPPLAERGLRDGVGSLYRDCFERGELLAVGEEAVSYRALMAEALGRFGRPSVVVCDAWKLDMLRQSLVDAGLRGVPVETRRFGPKDGSEDTLHFRRACLERRVVPERNVFLASAVAAARTISDPSRESALVQGQRRRASSAVASDDCAAAAILAISLAERNPPRPSSGVYLGLVG